MESTSAIDARSTHSTAVPPPQAPSASSTSRRAGWATWLVEARLSWLYSGLLVGIVVQRIAQATLDTWYARSLYPVPYYVGQLSFSAERLQRWYTFMAGQGTLGIYWRTQMIDFGFITSTALLFTILAALVARAFPAGSRGRRVASRMVPFAAIGPAFDVVENLLSFLMLPDPHHVNRTLALVYSSSAALKFAGFVAIAVWTLGALVVAVAVRVRGR
jgi:hypothetical protein